MSDTKTTIKAVDTSKSSLSLYADSITSTTIVAAALANQKCEVCKRCPAQSVSLFRVNPKGQPGIWRCRDDLTAEQRAAIDPEVVEIVGIIGGAP